jgi:DeoR family transcriptional regulator of aga operon
MNKYQGLNRRQRDIISFLRNKEYTTVEELADHCLCSQPTIRRDLLYLDSINYITRLRGGASINPKIPQSALRINRNDSYWEEKNRIGKKAAEFVHNGDMISINTGTTVMAFTNYLWEKQNLSIVSGDYEIALILSRKPDFNVTVLGGKVEKEVPGILGKFSNETIRSFHFDKCFIGVMAINPSDGLMTARYEQAETARAFIESSRRVFVITDSSKFSKRTGAIIAPLSSIHTLITDRGINQFPEIVEQIKNHQEVQLIIV